MHLHVLSFEFDDCYFWYSFQRINQSILIHQLLFLNLHRDPISFSTSDLLYINELPEYNTYLKFHSDSSVIMIEHIGN